MQLSCEQMICYDESNVEYPLNKCWRDGTICGGEKWCQHRECVEKSENTDPGQSYAWTVQWSKCSDLCNGIQYESANCVDESNQTVLDYLCCKYETEHNNQRPCNIDCSVGWASAIKINHGAENPIQIYILSLRWESKLSLCSAECGNGIQNISYSCVQRLTQNNSSSTDVDDSNCSSEMPSQETQECVGLCESAKWNYTEYESVRSGIRLCFF